MLMLNPVVVKLFGEMSNKLIDVKTKKNLLKKESYNQYLGAAAGSFWNVLSNPAKLDSVNRQERVL